MPKAQLNYLLYHSVKRKPEKGKKAKLFLNWFKLEYWMGLFVV